MYFDKIYNEILKESKRQDKKWGYRSHSQPKWMMILLEEIGEANQTFLQNEKTLHEDIDKYYIELIHSATVIFRMLEQLNLMFAGSLKKSKILDILNRETEDENDKN